MFDVAIIGAGLAGASVAHSLASRGKRILVIEKNSEAALSASNNRDAILSQYISDKDSDPKRVYTEGFEYSRKFLLEFEKERNFSCVRQAGALQFATTPRIKRVFQNPEIGRLTKEEIKERFDIEVAESALFLEKSCVVDMPRLTNELLNHKNVEKMYNSEVSRIEPTGPGWSLRNNEDKELINQVEHVVVASAHEAKKILQLKEIPLEPVRGELWSIPIHALSKSLETALLFGSYLTPPDEGYVTLGGSFKHNDLSLKSNDQELLKLLKELKEIAPQLVKDISPDEVKSRICFRTSTYDRFPYVGELPNFQSIREEMSKFRSGSDLKSRVPLVNFPGLWVSLGHGSKGLTTCLMAGELIAKQILDLNTDQFESMRYIDSKRLATRALHA